MERPWHGKCARCGNLAEMPVEGVRRLADLEEVVLLCTFCDALYFECPAWFNEQGWGAPDTREDRP
jgi:hypothetical protein